MRTLITLFKFLFPLAIIAGIIYGALYFMAPILTVELRTPQLTYDQVVTFRTTIHNPSPFPKEIKSHADTPDVVVLIDGATPPKEETKPTHKITLKPFSTQTVEYTVVMQRTAYSRKVPQVITDETTAVPMTDGQHGVMVSWSGYKSFFVTTYGIR